MARREGARPRQRSIAGCPQHRLNPYQNHGIIVRRYSRPHRRMTYMPLPKMPTRPAAILTFPSGEAARSKARASAAKPTAAAPATAAPAAKPLPVQPELEGIKSQAPAAVAPAPVAAPRAARGGKASTAGRKPKARAQSAVRKPVVLDTDARQHDAAALIRLDEQDNV